MNDRLHALLASIRVAALFHDLGKATRVFQEKLRLAIAGGRAAPDPVRHELLSALIWDQLCERRSEAEILVMLRRIKPADIDRAYGKAVRSAIEIQMKARKLRMTNVSIDFKFNANGGLSQAVGLLILNHHHLPGLSETGLRFTAENHIALQDVFRSGDLDHHNAPRCWHEDRWISGLRKQASILEVNSVDPLMVDLFGRTVLMMADHLASARKVPSDGHGLLANTFITDDGDCLPADSLITHTMKVTNHVTGAFSALMGSRNCYPSILQEDLPSSVMPEADETAGRFRWQGRAAEAARRIASEGGGFFACVMAGTGAGKTRAAPSILAAAAAGEPDRNRRHLRFTLALGLRTLATQSGKEYLRDLGFMNHDVAIMVGQPPIEFRSPAQEGMKDLDGIELLDAYGNHLVDDPSRIVPGFIRSMARSGGLSRGRKLMSLAAAPVICATIDHLIAAASPLGSNHLAASLRVMTSDLIIDEVDQFGSEDFSVVARLVNLAGHSGRKVMVMSATITRQMACVLAESYSRGWAEHARLFNAQRHVNYLCTSDADQVEACLTTRVDGGFRSIFETVSSATIEALSKAPACRSAEILPLESHVDVPAVVGDCISRMHDRHASDIEGYRVSFGFVRLTRVSHTAELARVLPMDVEGRLRLVLCLHSRFPRLHRSWIEDQLRGSLTRKGADPHAGLAAFCRDHEVFDRADARSTREIELVLICSPVIETGNDLDFDYAILDPSSTRSIIQSSGRVVRHRMISVHEPNIAILGRPLVSFDKGRVEMPGVETDNPEATRVSRLDLAEFGIAKPLSRELFDGPDLSKIDASWILDRMVTCPLLAAEMDHVGRFLCGDEAGLDNWMVDILRRNSSRQAMMRRFRRSISENVTVLIADDEAGRPTWMVDRNPLSVEKLLEPATLEVEEEPRHLIVPDIAGRAWTDRHGKDAEVTPERLREASEIGWPIYFGSETGKMIYSEALGLRRENSRGIFS